MEEILDRGRVTRSLLFREADAFLFDVLQTLPVYTNRHSLSSSYVMSWPFGMFCLSRSNSRVDGSGVRVEVWNGSVWVGPERTNNEAEYSGLIAGLSAAKKLGIKVSFVLCGAAS